MFLKIKVGRNGSTSHRELNRPTLLVLCRVKHQLHLLFLNSFQNMTSPLKITLKLSGPRPPAGVVQSPTQVSPKTSKAQDITTVESPRKRAKPNGRSRKPKAEGAPVLDR